MHKLLILGSLGEFVQMIEMAKARGIYTIVCDGYKGSIGKAHADKAYDIAVDHIDEIADMCRAEGVDGIITSFSDFLFECMVKIAEKANLKCYFGTEYLDYYRNKTKMKDMFRELGIGTSAYHYIEKDFQDADLADLHFPVVTKPVDKYGSRGLMVLQSIQEIREVFDEVCETSDIKQILVEEYHDGFEFNMMTWVLHGKVQVISIADREKTWIAPNEIPISTRNVYPSKRMDVVYEDAREILQKIVEFTGQQEGPLSIQFFWKPETGIHVCEVAGRFFGYEHELVEYAGGLNIEKLLLDYVYDEKAVEETFANYDPFYKKVSAVLYFHGKPGMTVVNQDAARKIASDPEVKESWLFYKDGEPVIKHGPNPYVVRYYITADDREKADKITQRIFSEISVTDAAGQEVLYKNQIGR